MAASGNSRSITRSGISGGAVTIIDAAGQQALTGQTVDERLATLNRDVETGKDGSNALKPIFNEKEIKAGFEIAGALVRETGTFINNRAKESTAAKETLDKELAKPEGERDQSRIAVLQQRLDDNATWAPGGAGRQVLTALAAAAGGNATGSSAQFAQGLVVNYVQQQGAGYIGKLVKDGTLAEGSPAHAALHAIVGCAGAAGSGKGCVDGALGAATSSLLTNLLSEPPNETAEQKEAKRNLLASLVTGIAAGAGADAATASGSVIAAIDNNYLSERESRALDVELATCKLRGGDCTPVIQKYIDLSNKNSAELEKKCGSGGIVCVSYEELIKGYANVALDENSSQVRLSEKLKDPDAIALVKYLNGKDLAALHDNISTTDRVMAVVIDPTSWPVIVMGGRGIIAGASGKEKLIAAGISGSASAGFQYGVSGDVKLSDVIGSVVVGAITVGKGYNPTVTWNVAGGYYSAEIKGDDPFLGALLSKVGAGLGYGVGGVIKIPFDRVLNPISKQYEWVETGIWTITRPMPSSPSGYTQL
ncbi:hypothetical protein [Cupriavidus sp. 8B]